MIDFQVSLILLQSFCNDNILHWYSDFHIQRLHMRSAAENINHIQRSNGLREIRKLKRASRMDL